MKALEAKTKVAPSSKDTYTRYLRKLYRILEEDNLDVTEENIKRVIDKEYASKRKNTKRLVTIIANTYILGPRKLGKLRVPRDQLDGDTKKNHYEREDLSNLVEASKLAEDDGQLYHCIRIAMATGMRIKEILDLTCRDIVDGCLKDPVQITVRRGKGGKSREIAVANSEKDYFLKELLPRATPLAEDDKFFTSKYDNMLKKLKTAMTRAGILDQSHRAFHGMRSYYCTKTYSDYAKNKFPYAQQILQNIMGHSSHRTTKRYIRPGREEMREYASMT